MDNIKLLESIVLLLSISIIIILTVKVKGLKTCTDKFYYNLVLMVFIITTNIWVILVDNLLVITILLVSISFSSFFIILSGYGVGSIINIVLFFKYLGDFLLIIITGFILNFNLNSNLKIWNTPEMFNFKIEIYLLVVFSIYSLVGFFGFWIYWGMEASYFTSIYLHSCGFISIGFLLLLKLNFNLVFKDLYTLKWGFYLIFIISYLIFIIISLNIKDFKKSFGYYSASSICFLFIISTTNPIQSIIYFFISSIIKIIIFELMSVINKVNKGKWFITILVLLNLVNYSVFIIKPVNSYFVLNIVYFVFSIKSYILIIFLIKLWGVSKTNINKRQIHILIFIISNAIIVLYKQWKNNILRFKSEEMFLLDIVYNHTPIVLLILIVLTIIGIYLFNFIFNCILFFKLILVNILKKMERILKQGNKKVGKGVINKKLKKSEVLETNHTPVILILVIIFIIGSNLI